jgi:hypothetical protein
MTETLQPSDEPAVFAGYKRSELEAAFTAVQDRDNWKKPIAAIVARKDVDVTIAAIVFFAGCSASVAPRDDDTWMIDAVGYYRAVGS